MSRDDSRRQRCRWTKSDYKSPTTHQHPVSTSTSTHPFGGRKLVTSLGEGGVGHVLENEGNSVGRNCDTYYGNDNGIRDFKDRSQFVPVNTNNVISNSNRHWDEMGERSRSGAHRNPSPSDLDSSICPNDSTPVDIEARGRHSRSPSSGFRSAVDHNSLTRENLRHSSEHEYSPYVPSSYYGDNDQLDSKSTGSTNKEMRGSDAGKKYTIRNRSLKSISPHRSAKGGISINPNSCSLSEERNTKSPANSIPHHCPQPPQCIDDIRVSTSQSGDVTATDSVDQSSLSRDLPMENLRTTRHRRSTQRLIDHLEMKESHPGFLHQPLPPQQDGKRPVFSLNLNKDSVGGNKIKSSLSETQSLAMPRTRSDIKGQNISDNNPNKRDCPPFLEDSCYNVRSSEKQTSVHEGNEAEFDSDQNSEILRIQLESSVDECSDTFATSPPDTALSSDEFCQCEHPQDSDTGESQPGNSHSTDSERQMGAPQTRISYEGGRDSQFGNNCVSTDSDRQVGVPQNRIIQGFEPFGKEMKKSLEKAEENRNCNVSKEEHPASGSGRDGVDASWSSTNRSENVESSSDCQMRECERCHQMFSLKEEMKTTRQSSHQHIMSNPVNTQHRSQASSLSHSHTPRQTPVTWEERSKLNTPVVAQKLNYPNYTHKEDGKQMFTNHNSTASSEQAIESNNPHLAKEKSNSHVSRLSRENPNGQRQSYVKPQPTPIAVRDGKISRKEIFKYYSRDPAQSPWCDSMTPRTRNQSFARTSSHPGGTPSQYQTSYEPGNQCPNPLQKEMSETEMSRRHSPHSVLPNSTHVSLSFPSKQNHDEGQVDDTKRRQQQPRSQYQTHQLHTPLIHLPSAYDSTECSHSPPDRVFGFQEQNNSRSPSKTRTEYLVPRHDEQGRQRSSSNQQPSRRLDQENLDLNLPRSQFTQHQSPSNNTTSNDVQSPTLSNPISSTTLEDSENETISISRATDSDQSHSRPNMWSTGACPGFTHIDKNASRRSQSADRFYEMIQAVKTRLRHHVSSQGMSSEMDANSSNIAVNSSSFLSDYIVSLWEHQWLCDVQVTVEGQNLLAHKLILAAFSDVFCPNDPHPPPSVTFEIPDSTYEAVEQIFRYMYTGNMDLTDELLDPVLKAALYMGVAEVVCLVQDIMNAADTTNIEMYMGISRANSLAFDFTKTPAIRRDMKSLIGSGFYGSLTEQEMEALLNDPDVEVESEEVTLRAVLEHAMARPEVDPGPELARLLRKVTLESIPPTKLVEMMAEYPAFFNLPEVTEIMLTIFQYHALKSKNQEELLSKAATMPFTKPGYKLASFKPLAPTGPTIAPTTVGTTTSSARRKVGAPSMLEQVAERCKDLLGKQQPKTQTNMEQMGRYALMNPNNTHRASGVADFPPEATRRPSTRRSLARESFGFGGRPSIGRRSMPQQHESRQRLSAASRSLADTPSKVRFCLDASNNQSTLSEDPTSIPAPMPPDRRLRRGTLPCSKDTTTAYISHNNNNSSASCHPPPTSQPYAAGFQTLRNEKQKDSNSLPSAYYTPPLIPNPNANPNRERRVGLSGMSSQNPNDGFIWSRHILYPNNVKSLTPFHEDATTASPVGSNNVRSLSMLSDLEMREFDPIQSTSETVHGEDVTDIETSVDLERQDRDGDLTFEIDEAGCPVVSSSLVSNNTNNTETVHPSFFSTSTSHRINDDRVVVDFRGDNYSLRDLSRLSSSRGSNPLTFVAGGRTTRSTSPPNQSARRHRHHNGVPNSCPRISRSLSFLGHDDTTSAFQQYNP